MHLPPSHMWLLLFLCTAWLTAHVWTCADTPTTVEDAGISFAYARNLAQGHGLVAWPGTERVEGYSNPLWVALLAFASLAGVSPVTASDGFGAVFGALAIPLAYALVRLLRPQGRGDAAVLGAALLAGSSQHLIWAGAGLENSLFVLLLLAGLVRLGTELQATLRHPWSALLFLLLVLTRPEAIAYSAFAGAAVALVSIRRGRLRFALAWLAAFSLPLFAYHAWRISYFAWPFPNTYYAKLGRDGVYQPFGWNTAGWSYIRDWFTQHRAGPALPLLGFAMIGASLRRWRVLLVGILTLAVLVAFDGTWGNSPAWWAPLQEHWIALRVWSIPTVAAVIGLVGLRDSAGPLRVLVWLCSGFGIFFALYSGGDWMRGHRWFGLIVATLLPLFAAGAGEAVDAVTGTEPSKRLRPGSRTPSTTPSPSILGVPGPGAEPRRRGTSGASIT